ncbi:hypothetical protein COLO4_08829 [Corchorus olitorius]|uniref:ABC-type xenobiotic transporter n=1 Tax=Corchorus olitorius TaxID=93759 RepID=A0A1R3KEG2_9ROSI|nr:hypothetical protein COLO4_08829 [Corchorus olitorius]
MGEGIWFMFCSNFNCSKEGGKTCISGLISSILDPYSCINHVFIISTDILLLFVAMLIIYKYSTNKITTPFQSPHFSSVPILSAIFNATLSIVYVAFGIWTIYQKLHTDQTVLPLDRWLVLLFQGFTWLLLTISVYLKKLNLPCSTTVKSCSILALLYAGFLCISSGQEAIAERTASVDTVLDVLSFSGSILFLACAFKGRSFKDTGPDSDFDACYAPLQGEGHVSTDEISFNHNTTPFEKAGILSKISFWWLNPLLKTGKEKILENQDIPTLQQPCRAQTCYSKYMDQLSQEKQGRSSDSPSMLSIIIHSHWKAMLISGILALIKVLTLSTGPLFLRAFIEVVQGKEAFKYEAYVLTVALLITKCLESLSERQWFFQTRVVGLQLRSMLSAAIYQKQLQLSNAAKTTHSPGEIVSYVTVDAYRIGEFPYWFHQIWSTGFQLCLALFIVYSSVGLATIAALFTVILTVIASYPLTKSQLECHNKLMFAQDKRLQAITEALGNMKVLKLHAWETHFKNVIESLRKDEFKWISGLLSHRGYNLVLYWSSPIIVPTVTFWTCYLLEIPLNASNIFTFLASIRIVQEPVRLIPDVVQVFIEAKVSLNRILKFLEAPELGCRKLQQECIGKNCEHSIFIQSDEISWNLNPTSTPTLRNIDLAVKSGEKIAICGEVGSGKSTLLAAVLGEVPKVNGIVQAYGKIAYVSQTAWIQTGSIQENILFGSEMDPVRYEQVLERCCLVKDVQMLPFGDLTEIGEKGVNLSGGQKQRVQLARALYQDADIYLLDDPFSAVDAKTATSLFNEYVMSALSDKTVLLVSHQVDFLPAFDSILLMSAGEIIEAATYEQLLASSPNFRDLVNAHKNTIGSEMDIMDSCKGRAVTMSMTSKGVIQKVDVKEEEEEEEIVPCGEQLIKKEERETGDTGFKPYMQYLRHDKSFLYFTLAILFHITFIVGQFIQYYWLAAEIQNYKVSSDLSIIDLEMGFRLSFTLGTTMNTYFSFIVLAVLAWPVAFVIIPMVYITILLQRHYHASAKELMRINGTTKSSVASHLAESVAGAMTIRAFGEGDRFFSKNMNLIDANASTDFHTFSANEWLIQRLEILCALLLSSSALAMTLIPLGASASASVERLEQYMHIPSEAPEVIEGNRPPHDWPSAGKVEIYNLKVRYRPNAPLVLQGINCTFEAASKIGIVGRTGSGKTTFIGVLFRLVEPTNGKIIIDNFNICTIGIHDLRSRLGIIPQDPTLFGGSVRYNLDPLEQYSDDEIWEVLGKCKLREAVQGKEAGLNSFEEGAVAQDGSNWSVGQRQLFCLGRALLKRSKILVLDEATASIDNATDSIIQKTIRTEFKDCTVIIVAHRIPTVMDCNMVLGISDGKLVEYDEPMKLMNNKGSLFGQLVQEYWSRSTNNGATLEDW